MIEFRIEARPYVDADIEAVFDWYEAEEPGLAMNFWTNSAQPIFELSMGHSSIRTFVPAFGVLLQDDFHRQPTLQSKLTSLRFWQCSTHHEIPRNGSFAWSKLVLNLIK